MNAVIHVCSRQQGFAHAPFNAGLLQTILMAYPESIVKFKADASHLAFVEAFFPATRSDICQRLLLEEVPHEGRLSARTIARRVGYLWNLLHDARQDSAVFLVLADLSNDLLWIFKLMAGVSGFKNPILIVAHDLYERLAWPVGNLRRLYYTKPLWPPFPRTIRYLVLSEHIRQAVEKFKGGTQHDIEVMDHPLPVGRPAPPPSSPGLRFGLLGTPGKGLQNIATVAREIRRVHPDVAFVCAGYVSPAEAMEFADILGRVSTVPISYSTYTEIINSLTYGVWFAFNNHYRFRVSGTMVELLMFGKPSLYLRNRLVESYFNRFGNIGYICENMDNLQTRILQIANSFPEEEYREQESNIIKAQASFIPATLAPRFVEIAEGIKAGLDTPLKFRSNSADHTTY